MNLIFFGAPGAGKGTQTKIVSARFNVPVISTGDIFRKTATSGTELGKKVAELINNGRLVPDDVVMEVVAARLAEGDCKNGFLLDGFPRTLVQGRELDKYLEARKQKIDKVIFLDVSEENVVSRLSTRRICRVCKHEYNIVSVPPKKEGICDICGGELYQRQDDKEETIRHRLSVYRQQTQPLIEYYRGKNILVTVDGNRPVKDISSEILGLL